MTSVAESTTRIPPSRGTVPVRALVTGLSIAFVVALGRLAGELDGSIGLLLASALIVLAPTGRTVSQRLLVSSGLLPWLAVLWWVRIPLGDLGRSTLLMALAAGTLGGYVAAAPSPLTRLRTMLPTVRPVDMAPPVAGALACWPLWPWLAAPDAPHALAALLRGWDNSAHFSMTDMIVREGAVTSALPLASDGSRWGFAEYPQHFHVAVAALMELLQGPPARTSLENLLTYTHALALVLVCGVVVVVAAVICVVPAGHRNPYSWTVSAALVLVFGYGAGLRSLEVGHPNFLLGTETVVSCVALSLMLRARPSWLVLTALGGSAVAVANEWLPLAPMAAVAFLSGLTAIKQHWPDSRSTRGIVLTVGATCVTALAGVPRLLTLDVGHVLVLAGEVQVENTYVMFAVILTAAVLPTATRAWSSIARPSADHPPRQDPPDHTARRTAAVPITGFATFTAVFGYQIFSIHHASYYAIKLLIGVAMVSWGVIGIQIVLLLPRSLPRPLRQRSMLAAVGLVIVALAVDAHDSLRLRTDAESRSRLMATSRLLDAAQMASHRTGSRPVYLGVAPGDPIFSNGDQWFMALTSAWTRAREKTNAAVPAGLVGTKAVAVAARTLLARDHSAQVIVNPDDLPWVRREVLPRDRPRVVTWRSRTR